MGSSAQVEGACGILGRMSAEAGITDGVRCEVVAGTHAGKSGTVQDMKTSKTGAVTITVVQDDGIRFKTLAKNVRAA